MDSPPTDTCNIIIYRVHVTVHEHQLSPASLLSYDQKIPIWDKALVQLISNTSLHLTASFSVRESTGQVVCVSLVPGVMHV